MTRTNKSSARRFVSMLALVCAFASITAPTHAAPRETRAFEALQSPQATPRKEPPPAAAASYRSAAKELSLGTRAMASHLLRSAPEKSLREHAPGDGAEWLAWPIDGGSFVRGFGYVRKVRKDLPHLGVDIAAKTGTPIHVVADGIVAYADDGVKGYGNLAIVVHADGSVTSYAHCSKLLVVPGQPVTRGETIALVGSTGISKGPHLHFEYRKGGKPRNPMARFERAERAEQRALAMAD